MMNAHDVKLMLVMPKTGKEVLTCRSCGSHDLKPFLDLGLSPIANQLISADDSTDDEEKFPLAVSFCPQCSLVQLSYELPADVIFNEAYPYYTSFSDAFCAHAKRHVDGLLATRSLASDSLVVELASNDGYLLKNFVAAGIPVLGIDPAPGPARAAEAIGVPTIVDFFGVEAAERIVANHRKANVIIANNVMAHVPDLNDFVGGMAVLLADDGVITVENPYVRELVEHVEYDTVYHEHFCYFSCTAVAKLVARHGLTLNHVEYFPNLHGGTCRWYISHSPEVSDTARQYLDDEAAKGMGTFEFYESFGEQVNQSNAELSALLHELKASGKTIAAYGAAAKGCTLLNAAGLGKDLIDFVADRNPHKQGHLLPGVHIPIVDVSEITKRQPDYILLLAWNFKDEIMSQQAEYVAAGGKFIVPMPHATIL
jgi:C-methyltransferase C-terminal domain/Putative zinc binding domain/Methyltransferase domain